MYAPSPVALAAACRSSRLGFFIAGFGLAVWAPLVPYVRERISMSDAVFGLLLLCVGIGSLSCMPLSSRLVARFGVRSIALSCIGVLLLALIALSVTRSIFILGLSLLAFGASLGVLDVVLNIQSLLLEKTSQRRLLSNFHGIFSLGTLAGALSLTALLSVSTAPQIAVWILIAILVVLSFFCSQGLIQLKLPSQASTRLRPHGWVLMVGAMCFVVYLAEGAILDWSALLLTQDKAMPIQYAGLGYTCFALMVALARLVGDKLAQQLGNRRLIILGSLIGCGGMLLSVLSPYWSLALVGYALCGLGCANISPALISSLNQQNTMAVSDAVTAATTIGFAGVLAGPALMGAIAHYSELSLAFLCVTGLIACLILPTRRFSQ